MQIVSVMEDRARSVDLMKHKYYDLLYCYHITKHNYRKGTEHLTYGVGQICHTLAIQYVRLSVHTEERTHALWGQI